MIMEAEKMCSWQAENPRKPMVRFQYKSQQVWESRRTNASFQVRRQEKTSPKAVQAIRQEEFPLTPDRIRLSCSIQVFTWLEEDHPH